MKITPILLLEMNEIPWRVIDLYKSDARFPHITRFFNEATTYTTMAVDEGELSPWVTWPSLHRGLSNTEHGILNLGQDPGTFKGTPIWEEYRARSLPIGLCGSLQSWPPQDPGTGGFYIPDTFAHDERCIPAYVEPLQRFNLGQVRKNGRVLQSRSFSVAEGIRTMLALPRLGIRFGTVAAIVAQLWGERRDQSLLARRSIFQTVLFWDIFKSLFNPKNPPAFSTFFTNHVAGVMHRYWHHTFPEDFGNKFAADAKPHKATMDFAMGYVDRMLKDAFDFQNKNPDLAVVFATSMGQAAVNRDKHEGFEASVPDIAALMRVMGLSEGLYRTLIAMVPQIAVDVDDAAHRAQLLARLTAARTVSGVPLFTVQEIGSSLSITICTPSLADIHAGRFTTSEGTSYAWAEAGIAMNPVEPGTAYHIPEGILAVRRVGVAGKDARTVVSADRVKTLLMQWAGLGGASQATVPA